jgi:peptidase M24
MNEENRRKRFKETLTNENCDCFLVTKRENIRYLTGFTGSFSFLLFAQNKVFLLTDFRYMEQASKETSGVEIVQLKKYHFSYFIFEIMKKEGYQNLGFEFSNLSYEAYTKLTHFLKPERLIAYQNFVEDLRMVKDKDELILIEQAEAIGDMAFKNILSFIKVGVKEKDLALELDYQMRKLGASGNSFETIVASGYRGALPHGIASEKVIEDGDLVVMDFGCFYQGYASDMTRTVGVGKVSQKAREVYQVVLEAQLHALEGIKAGLKGKEIHFIAEKVIDEAGYGAYFGHGLGHSVGLEIHESPNFNPLENRLLQAGMCITVEPGIYLPNEFGIRIEDLIVVEENGYKNLTKSPKELLIF